MVSMAELPGLATSVEAVRPRPLPRPLLVEGLGFLDVIAVGRDFPFFALGPLTLEALVFLAAILREDLGAFCSCWLGMVDWMLDTR